MTSQGKKTSEKSYLFLFVRKVINFLLCFSIYDLLRRFVWKHHELLPFWFAELYILVWAILIVVGLAYVDPTSSLYVVLLYASIYRLTDMFLGQCRLIFIERKHRKDANGYYLLARHVERWILLIFINIFEIVACFAVLYLYWGNDFCKKIEGPLEAFYQSILTITTLGYGEIHANGQASQFLVIMQLFYFIFYFLLIAPMVFSSFRTKEVTEEVFGKTHTPDE